MIAWTVKRSLDELYARYNRREMVQPDPLKFLYAYPDRRDREIVALVASSLAYGRVTQILQSVARVLDRMPAPAIFLRRSSEAVLRRTFRDFKHRFTTGAELSALLVGAKRAAERRGALLGCFKAGLSDADDTVLPALSAFVKELSAPSGGARSSLLASPADGSACKRLNLFLRWMVRHDEVDPGGWEEVGASRLIIPLDTHIFRISRTLGLTRRNQADLKTALEITAELRRISPDDPIRYDFALSRLGIRKDANEPEFYKSCRVQGARATSGANGCITRAKAIERTSTRTTLLRQGYGGQATRTTLLRQGYGGQATRTTLLRQGYGGQATGTSTIGLVRSRAVPGWR